MIHHLPLLGRESPLTGVCYQSPLYHNVCVAKIGLTRQSQMELYSWLLCNARGHTGLEKKYPCQEKCSKLSDETFYTQSQIIVEKVPEFSAESLCLRQGMVTSGRLNLFIGASIF